MSQNRHSPLLTHHAAHHFTTYRHLANCAGPNTTSLPTAYFFTRLIHTPGIKHQASLTAPTKR